MDIEDFEGVEDAEEQPSAWDMLTPEQKKYFKKLTEKNKENLIYIG